MSKLITVDGKEWAIKYKKNEESVSFDVGTSVFRYPDFVGSKLYQNSSSSDKYTLAFSIHKDDYVSFKESLKKFVSDESKAINHPVYGKLNDIILESIDWGAIRGKIVGSVVFNTSSEADIMCRCTFHENTPDIVTQKKDFNEESTDAIQSVDLQTTTNFDVDLTANDKSVLQRLTTSLNALYSDIQNSQVVSAFNDLNTQLNKTILESMEVMNAFKKIVELPNNIFPNIANRLNLLKQQAVSIKNSPVSSYNLALFNANLISYNMGITSRSVFVSEAALQAAAGIKSVNLS